MSNTSPTADFYFSWPERGGPKWWHLVSLEQMGRSYPWPTSVCGGALCSKANATRDGSKIPARLIPCPVCLKAVR